METLVEDAMIKLLSDLASIDKLNFMRTCIDFNQLKYKILYDDQVAYIKIRELSYYDRFTNVITCDIVKFPSCVQKITFQWYFNQSIEKGIPASVKHLTFGDGFNQ